MEQLIRNLVQKRDGYQPDWAVESEKYKLE